MPFAKFTVSVVTTVFLEYWIVTYGKSNKILTDKRPQFLSKFSAALCDSMRNRLFTPTEYHLESNGQVEWFNKTLVARLRHYIDENQTDWDLFMQPIAYGYNTQVHCTTRTFPISLIHRREPPRDLTSKVETTEEVSRLNSAQEKLKVVEQFFRLRARANIATHTARESYARHFIRRVRHSPVFWPGELVFLKKPPALKASKVDRAKKIPEGSWLRKTKAPIEL